MIRPAPAPIVAAPSATSPKARASGIASVVRRR